MASLLWLHFYGFTEYLADFSLLDFVSVIWLEKDCLAGCPVRKPSFVTVLQSEMMRA